MVQGIFMFFLSFSFFVHFKRWLGKKRLCVFVCLWERTGKWHSRDREHCKTCGWWGTTEPGPQMLTFCPVQLNWALTEAGIWHQLWSVFPLVSNLSHWIFREIFSVEKMGKMFHSADSLCVFCGVMKQVLSGRSVFTVRRVRMGWSQQQTRMGFFYIVRQFHVSALLLWLLLQ